MGFSLLGHQGPTPRAGLSVRSLLLQVGKPSIFPSPSNPSSPAKLSACRYRFSYLCRGSRDPPSHLQIQRTKSQSREMPSALRYWSKTLPSANCRRAACPPLRPARARACVCVCLCVCVCGSRRNTARVWRGRTTEGGCHTGAGNVRVRVRACVLGLELREVAKL